MAESFNILGLIGKGKGGFSEIYLVNKKGYTDNLVMKEIHRSKMNEMQASLINNEINILSKVNHINIIKLYEVKKDVNNIYNKYFILEYCKGGTLEYNLYKYIQKYKIPFTEKIVQKIMKNLLFGVKYLHDNGIIHRDLKLDNILVNYQNQFDYDNLNIYNAEIKIIDFKKSCWQNLSRSMPLVGTLPNMAPNANIINNNEKIDIWSLGFLCYEMLFGKPLFTSKNIDNIYADLSMGNLNIPKTISVQARTFLYCMLSNHNNNRFTATELLNQEFIVGDYHKFKRYDITGNNSEKINIDKINIDKSIICNSNTSNNKFNNISVKPNDNIYLKTEKNIQINNNIKYSSTDPNFGNKLRQKMNMSDNAQHQDNTPHHNLKKKCAGCQGLIMDKMYICSKCGGLFICERCYLNFYQVNHPHIFNKFEPRKKLQQKKQLLKKNTINTMKIKFMYENSTFEIPIYNHNLINELINKYLEKINRYDLMNYYDNAFQFIYKSKLLNDFKDISIDKILVDPQEYVIVKQIRSKNIQF